MRVFKTKWFQKWAAREGMGNEALLAAVEEMHASLAFFVYGFAKNERANISNKELKVLKLLATQLLGYIPPALTKAIKAGELIEVTKDG